MFEPKVSSKDSLSQHTVQCTYVHVHVYKMLIDDIDLVKTPLEGPFFFYLLR